MRIRMRRDLVCRQAVSLMTDYLDGSLSSSDARRLERHLADCPDCTEYLKQLRITVGLSARIDSEPLDLKTQQSLIAMYRAWQHS
jgi:anti-sigma factor RsiW